MYDIGMMMNWLLFGVGLIGPGLIDALFGSEDENGESQDENVGETTILGSEDDVFEGTAEDDTIYGMTGDDFLLGAAGDDYVEGNVGNDTIFGGLGDDVISGGGGTDTLYGGEGNDLLFSDRADDEAEWTRGDTEMLFGGSGDDILFFGGDDTAEGGSGADTFGMIHTEEGPSQIVDFDPILDDAILYVDGLDEATEEPTVRIENDIAEETTTVYLDDDPVIVFGGLFSSEEIDLTVADTNTIDFAR